MTNPHIRQLPYEPVTTVEEAREYHLRLAQDEPKITIKEREDEDGQNMCEL